MEEYGNNISRNGTSCFDNYCVESTLYRKITGTILFILIWPFIVLDIKWFPLGRPAASLVGGVLMVLFMVVPQDQVYLILGDKGNLQTLFLLIGMMLLSYYYDREGILQYITLWIFGKEKPFKHVLWKVCVLSAILSAIITNDATCLVLTPLLLAEHIKQERSKTEYPPLLLGIATSANIGSASTFFGNPQNAFIAANSEGQVSLLIFFITTLPPAVLGLAISISLLYLCYFRIIWPKRTTSTLTTELNGGCNGITVTENEESAHEMDNNKSNGVVRNQNHSLSNSREELALSYDRSNDPTITSQISHERHVSLEDSGRVNTRQKGSVPSQNGSAPPQVDGNFKLSLTTCETSSTSLEYGATQNYDNHIRNYILSGRVSRFNDKSNSDRFGSSMQLSDNSPLQESVPLQESCVLIGESNRQRSPSQTTWKQRFFIGWLVVITCILVILLAIPPPPVVTVEFNLGLVPVAAGVMTMLMDTLINKRYGFDAMMKVDWTVILMFMGLFIWLRGFENTLFPTYAFEYMRTYMDLYSVQGVLIFTVFVVVGSNVLSNVPLVILIADQLFSFECGADKCTGQLTGVVLAWISTIAGNFTLIGSVANLIVAEKARNIAEYRLSFWEYLKFGFFSTILVLFSGLPMVFFAGDNVSI